MHSVTIYFPNKEDADWFAKLASRSIRAGQRLAPVACGILLDSVAKATEVDGPNPPDPGPKPSRQPANT